jgi:hypothetical protein
MLHSAVLCVAARDCGVGCISVGALGMGWEVCYDDENSNECLSQIEVQPDGQECIERCCTTHDSRVRPAAAVYRDSALTAGETPGQTCANTISCSSCCCCGCINGQMFQLLSCVA